ncbi:phage tail protein [Devosia sp. YIM 151766]|uniref:phage tail protein n=1 Tax=Devosia sp. YIM 151766 TaxID=3017325 RepID=UPI00255C4EF1|nr:phage tail protein [Devosia sp. YIM 151766]WIY54162.1 phage tail protein [Devosia sp. YIM 151766]
MLLRAFRAVLLGGTMLFALPTAAHADPVSVAILGWMGYGGAAGLLAPTAVLTSLIGNAVMAALPGFLLNLAIGVGVTMLANALRPQQNSQAQDPGSRIVNLRQSIQDRSRSYGRVRTGGPVAFWKLKNGRRYVAVLYNTGEIDAVESVYLDETEVTLNGDGYVTQSRFTSDGSSMVRISHFLGTPGQTSHPWLAAAFPEWTSNHRLQGIAGSVMVCRNPKPEDFAKVYSSGREPTVSSVYRASKVLDPRDNVRRWTTNAALVIADWITSSDGLGQEVDWDEVAYEADVADVLMRTRGGDWIPRWQLCGTYFFSQTREEVRKQLAMACDAWFYDRPDGKVGFKLGRWMEPQVTIRAHHINSIKLGEGQDGETQQNALSVEYVEAAAGYRQFPSAAVTINDGNAYNQASVAAHWIPNHTQACAVGKRTLRAMRSPLDITLNLKLYGLLLMPADGDDSRTFAVDCPEFDIVGTYELADFQLAPDGMSVTVTGKLTQQADWLFDGLYDEPEPSAISDVTVTDDITDPTGVTLSSPDAGALYVAFNPPSRASLLKRIRYRRVGATDWSELGVPASQDFLWINGLPPGDAYEAQVQFRTATANASNWVASNPASVVISATSTPPGPVTGATASGGAGEATFDWFAPNSPNYVGALIYINTVNTFPGGVPAATEYGLPNAPDSRVVTGLSAGAKFGWIVAINASGDGAAPVATGGFTVT